MSSISSKALVSSWVSLQLLHWLVFFLVSLWHWCSSIQSFIDIQASRHVLLHWWPTAVISFQMVPKCQVHGSLYKIKFSYSFFRVLVGIVTLLFSGITLKHYAYDNMSLRTKRATKYVFQVLSQLSENFIFIYLGVNLFTQTGLDYKPIFILVTTVSLALCKEKYMGADTETSNYMPIIGDYLYCSLCCCGSFIHVDQCGVPCARQIGANSAKVASAYVILGWTSWCCCICPCVWFGGR